MSFKLKHHFLKEKRCVFRNSATSRSTLSEGQWLFSEQNFPIRLYILTGSQAEFYEEKFYFCNLKFFESYFNANSSHLLTDILHSSFRGFDTFSQHSTYYTYLLLLHIRALCFPSSSSIPPSFPRP